MEDLSATVVFYNPDNSAFDNIKSYLEYVNLLIIVDNSEYPTIYPDSLIGESKIQIINNKGNLGIATALNIGARMSIQNGYFWMLTMDQDSNFDKIEAEKYFSLFRSEKQEALGILSPSQLDVSEGTEQPLIVMTSGNIINLKSYQQIGGFCDKLFIDEVDHDYCLRTVLAKFDIKQAPIKMNHSLGSYTTFTAFGKKLVISTHSPIRLYYIVRNNLYMFEKYGKLFPKLISERKLMLTKVIFNNLFFDLKSLPKKLSYLKRAFTDYKQGKYGKYTG